MALSEAAHVLDAATSTASAIQGKAEEILGLDSGALKPKRAAIEKFMKQYEHAAFLRVQGEMETLARAKLLQMQFEHGVTPDNFMTLEELRTSSPKTYAMIFAEVKHESLSGEDTFYLAKGDLAERKKRRPNVKKERSEASIQRDKKKDAEFDKRMREEELRRAADAARTEALRQERIAKEAAAKAEEERREQEIEDRRERLKNYAKGREETLLKEEDESEEEMSFADAEEKRPPPAPKRAPPYIGPETLVGAYPIDEEALRKLKRLHDDGIIDDDEFRQGKAKALGITPNNGPPPKRKAPVQVPSRRRTGGAFIQARHAVDATLSL